MAKLLTFNFWIYLVISILMLIGGYLYFESYQRQTEITQELLLVERSLNAVNSAHSEIQHIILNKRGFQYNGSPIYLANIDSSKLNLQSNIDDLDELPLYLIGIDSYEDWKQAVDTLLVVVDAHIALIQLQGVDAAKSSILADEPMSINLNQDLDHSYTAIRNFLVNLSKGKESDFRTYQSQNFYGFLLLFGASFMLMGLGTYLSIYHVRHEVKIESDQIRYQLLKEREEATKTERDRLDFVLSGANAGLWEWNVQTGETIFDERWASIIGYRLEELMPVNIDTWVKFTHPDDLPVAQEQLNACFRRETDLYQCEFRMRHRQGHWIWILDRGSVRKWTDDGKPELMFGTHIDISESKNIALALAEKERMYRGIFNSTYQIVALLDSEGHIIEMNESGVNFTSLDSDEIKDSLLWECRCWFDDEHSRQAVKECVESSLHGVVEQREVLILDLNKKPKTILFNSKPIFNDIGKVEFIIAEGRLIQDIVDARHALINKNEELDKFASVASHDMKEPLRMIASFMQLLEKKYADKLDDKARQYIHFAVDGAKRMTNLINELLSYARVSRDMKEVEDVDLNSVVTDVTNLFRDVIRESKAQITVEQLPVVRGYPVALRTLFNNLISNGIKYQPPGQIAKLKIYGQDAGDEWHITLSDNGIGIAEEYHEEIFKLFKRLHTADQYPGTGLGLSTCKRIVDEHGGNISVASSENEGSTFKISLPKRGIHGNLAGI